SMPGPPVSSANCCVPLRPMLRAGGQRLPPCRSVAIPVRCICLNSSNSGARLTMPTLIIGVLVLVAALWAVGKISKADPKIAARVVKLSGGILSLLLAVFLFVRGQAGFAIPLGAFGLGLLGWLPF